MAAEVPTERQYVVLSKRFVAGEVGDTVTLAVTDNQELSLLESGAVRVAGPEVKLTKEVKRNG